MGQAKQRGSFEDRKQAAIAAQPKPLSEETKQQMRNHIKKLGEQEENTARQLIRAHVKHTRMDERILNSAATQNELKGE